MLTQEEYLELELEQYREAERQRQEEWLREANRRRQERKALIEESCREARDWPEALGKQARLLWREFGQFAADDDGGEAEFFAQGARACKRALEIWGEIAQRRQAEVEALLARMAEIEKEIRDEVADRLEAEVGGEGWVQVVEDLRTEENCSDWLNW